MPAHHEEFADHYPGRYFSSTQEDGVQKMVPKPILE